MRQYFNNVTKSWHNTKNLFKLVVTGKISDASELRLKNTCRLWIGVRLLECILKNHNLFQSWYVVLRTKKWGRSYGYKIEEHK